MRCVFSPALGPGQCRRNGSPEMPKGSFHTVSPAWVIFQTKGFGEVQVRLCTNLVAKQTKMWYS